MSRQLQRYRLLDRSGAVRPRAGSGTPCPRCKDIEWVAILRLDGDFYESTTDALTNLYPGLSRGGFCIIDDYALPACAEAVEKFRAENDITTSLERIDFSGRLWRKP